MMPRIYTQPAPSFAIQSYLSSTVKHRIPSLQSDAGSPVHGTRSAGGEFIPVTRYLDIKRRVYFVFHVVSAVRMIQDHGHVHHK